MIEWTNDQQNMIDLLRQFLNDTSDEGYDFPFVVNGAAGCLVGDTKIKLANETIVTLKTLYENKDKFIGEYVYSYDIVDNCWKFGRITGIYNTGFHKIARTILSNGTIIKSTYDHRFLTKDNKFVRADKLKHEKLQYKTKYLKSLRQRLLLKLTWKILKNTYDINEDILTIKTLKHYKRQFGLFYPNYKSVDEFWYYAELLKNIDYSKISNKSVYIKDVYLTDEEEVTYDLTIDQFHNYGVVDNENNLIFTHNTGKTFTLTEYLNKTNLKYMFLCYTGKAANVCARHGIPSETIHHCLYLPTDLNVWKKYSQKINYGLIDCNGVVDKNPDWNEKDLNTEYKLTYTGDRDVIYYIRKNRKGEDVEEIVNNESDIPDEFEPMYRHEENVEQHILGRRDMFKEWNTEDKFDMKQFLEYQNIIGFEDLRDESEGGSWLFKLRADRLYQVDVLVIDEYGMVPRDMMEQLLKVCKEMKVKLILSGDPHQLSPISKENVPLKFEPSSVLTQIMRQSTDNPILQFATLIRLYGVKTAINRMFKGLNDGIVDNNKFMIIDEDNVTDEFLKQYTKMNTQVLCGKNVTRKWLNKRIKGNTKLEVGDKIIITEINDWDYNIDESQYLTNGTQGIITKIESPEEHFYPEWRPRFDNSNEIDYENPILIEKPTKYDLSHDYRLSNYICKVDFESTKGEHVIDNRRMLNLPIAICRSFDDERFEDWQYLPRTSVYGIGKNGRVKKVKSKDKLTYSYDHIVENFEGSDKELNKNPKFRNDKITKKYRKCYEDFYSCPDFRKKRRVEKLNGDIEKVVYNTEKTKPYYLNGHIAEHSYAITVHKSQGSEYDDVMVWFEPFGTQKNIREQLYTAVTRAKETLVLVLTKEAQDSLGLQLS